MRTYPSIICGPMCPIPKICNLVETFLSEDLHKSFVCLDDGIVLAELTGDKPIDIFPAEGFCRDRMIWIDLWFKCDIKYGAIFISRFVRCLRIMSAYSLVNNMEVDSPVSGA